MNSGPGQCHTVNSTTWPAALPRAFSRAAHGPATESPLPCTVTPELIATVLGIAMAGTACVPLDVTYPTARLSAMLDQAEPAAVIIDSANESLIETHCPRIGLADLLTSAPPRPHTLPTVDPRHTAYVLFTSGSTGTPKGVVMPHRALANLIQWQLSVPSGWLAEAGRAPSTLQFAPLSFDVAFQEIYSTLCGGGRLILLTAQERRELPSLLRILDDMQAERVILPYVALQALADIVVRRGAAPSHLRIIASSGEQLRITDEIRALCAAIDGVILENQYGPTETHVVTRYSMTGDAREFPALPPIGTRSTMSRYWCWTGRACRCPMVSPVRSASPESPWPTATTADPTSPTRCSGRSRRVCGCIAPATSDGAYPTGRWSPTVAAATR